MNDSNNNILCYKINENELLEVINEIVSYYLFKEEQVLILTDSYQEGILTTNIFKDLDKRLLYLDGNYNIEELISYLLLNLQEQTGKTIISKVELLYRSINKKQDILKQISNFFNNCNYDIPLIEKYILTGRKLDSNHTYNKYYRTFRIKNPFKNYNYNELKEACKKILSSGLSTQYIQYRRFVDNDIYNYLKLPLDYNLINDSIYLINTIIDNKEIEHNLIVSIYTEDFIDAYISNEIIDEDYILSLTNIVNLKYNYKLLNKTITKKWFNIFKKYNKNKDEENLKAFSKIKDEIYNEYLNNYNYLNKLKEKLSFLKSIIREEKYNELIITIIKSKNIYENLNLYKRIFNIAYKNRNIFNTIDNISSIEENILKYCYDDLEEKKYIDELLTILPMLKCYLDIEEEEIKNTNIIELYKEYDSVINSIYTDNYKKNTIMSKAINKIWDNKLRSSSSKLKENVNTISEDELNSFFPCTVSSLSNENIQELINKNLKFNKIIVISNEEDRKIDFESISKISKTILSLDIDNKIREFNFNKENNYIINENNEILSEIKYFLLDKNINLHIIINNPYMEIKTNEYRIILLLNNSLVSNDVFLYKYYMDNNINIYRLWNRDWWVNKYKELNKINEYINELTISNK